MSEFSDPIDLLLNALPSKSANSLSVSVPSSVPAEPCRLFHGRGHNIPQCSSINIDLLPPFLLITIYREWDEEALERLGRALMLRYSPQVVTILLQRRYLKPAVFEALQGGDRTESVRDSHVVSEAGLNYRLYFNSGMHTGLFLDMAAARKWLLEKAYGKRVLNLFAYTCAFSVVAIAGGAQQVVNIDMSSSALAKGRENHRLNNQNLGKVKFLAHDIFKSWGKLRRHGDFDMVIVDPPSYQPGSFIADKDYARLVRRLPELVSDGADLLFCLNDPTKDTSFIKGIIAEQSAGFLYQERLDNPVGFSDIDPERALKVLHYKYFDQVNR